ncbi:hypothetical protein EMCRGX_G011972 [Ephydatia muelleri]
MAMTYLDRTELTTGSGLVSFIVCFGSWHAIISLGVQVRIETQKWSCWSFVTIGMGSGMGPGATPVSAKPHQRPSLDASVGRSVGMRGQSHQTKLPPVPDEENTLVNEELHKSHLEQAFQRLRVAGLTLRGSKCQIGMAQTMGHSLSMDTGVRGVISEAEGKPDRSISSRIPTNWPAP